MITENRRMYNIGTVFYETPIIFIRYNPDGYKDCNNIKGMIPPKKRQETLVKWIKKCFRHTWENGIYVKYLFYDGYNESDSNFIKLEEKDL